MKNLAFHWENLRKQNSNSVCKRSLANFNDGVYCLDFLGKRYLLDSKNETISGPGKDVNFELKIALLVYLVNSQDMPFSNKWVSANELPNSSGFFTGIHTFPVEKIIKKFSGRTSNFIDRCIQLGGERLDFSPLSVALQPLPRIKIGFVYWEGGKEFQDKVNVILDYNCGFQMPPDALLALVCQVILVIVQ